MSVVTAVVGVHGIGQQLKGERVLTEAWLPAMRDGIGRGSPRLADQASLCVAFYGDLFRPSGRKAVGEPPYDANDVEDGTEKDLLTAWWSEATRCEGVPGEGSATKARTPLWVQRGLDALSSSRYFAGIAERAMIADLRQVRLFLTDSAVKAAVLDRVVAKVTDETRVIVGHSLGSVVAYEALCAHPEWRVKTFITLGSPLGIRNIVLDKLTPRPRDGIGVWPGSVTSWVNIADTGDVVALQKRLAPYFGSRVRDELIHNGASAHDVSPYLTSSEAGRAIAIALS